MSEKTTEMLIHNEDILSIEATNPPVNFKGKGVFLRRNGLKFHGYYRLADLSRTDDLRIIEIDDDKHVVETKLPREMVDRISKFLQQEKELIPRFDCHSFVHYCHDIPFIKGYLDWEYWNILKSEETALEVGDAVFLSSSNTLEGVVHSAIYMGNGRYLSKFGSSGKLVVTDLDNMKKGWSGDILFRAKPKKKI